MDKGFRRSWFLILVTMCLIILISFLGLIPFFQNHYYLTLLTGELSILIPTAIGLCMLRREGAGYDEYKRLFHPSLIPALILLPFCMQIFLSYLLAPLQSVLNELAGPGPDVGEGVLSAGDFFMQAAAVCAVPAVVEEFLFRGVVMRLLKPYGMAASMIFSALAFTMMHFDIASFPVIFMLGMLMGSVRIMTGSVWACVLIHFSNNFSALLSSVFIDGAPDAAVAAVNILSLIIFPAAVIYLAVKTKPNVVGLRDREKKKTGFSPEMCICLLIFAGMTVIQIV